MGEHCQLCLHRDGCWIKRYGLKAGLGASVDFELVLGLVHGLCTEAGIKLEVTVE